MDIILKNISKSFGENEVLKSFSAIFGKGSVTCIMGRSGCGKTTLLNIIMGFVRQDSGAVTGLPEKLSAVFQEDRLCDNFNAVTNVALALEKPDRQMITAELTRLGLGQHLKTPVKDLSGGMKRRTAIVRAVVAKSDLLILDEPFKGLDEQTKTLTAAYIAEKAAGKTIIMVAHDKSEAIMMNAQIIEMSPDK